MNLLIKIENGKTVNHPIAEDNLRYFYPDLDVDHPPEGYARFVRKELPHLDMFQKIDSITYVIDEDLSKQYGTKVWTDKYNVEELSDEEMRQVMAEIVRTANKNMEKTMNAPYPAPDDGEFYVWSETSDMWIKMPDNFAVVINKFYEKIKEFGLEGVTPENLEEVEGPQRLELEKIIAELNT